jgi:hypothetical protein
MLQYILLLIEGTASVTKPNTSNYIEMEHFVTKKAKQLS